MAFHLFKTLDFEVMYALAPIFINETTIFLGYKINYIDAISFLLFIGAMGKSAQIGLHT